MDKQLSELLGVCLGVQRGQQLFTGLRFPSETARIKTRGTALFGTGTSASEMNQHHSLQVHKRYPRRRLSCPPAPRET